MLTVLFLQCSLPVLVFLHFSSHSLNLVVENTVVLTCHRLGTICSHVSLKLVPCCPIRKKVLRLIVNFAVIITQTLLVLTEDLASCFSDDLFLSHSRLCNCSLVVVERVRHYMPHLLHLLSLLRIVVFEALFTNDVRI
jgi:hypothetical protein